MIVVEQLVPNPIKDQFKKQVFQFGIIDLNLVLNRYEEKTKTVKQRKWRLEKCWDKLGRNMDKSYHLLTEPFISDEIKKMAIEKAAKQLRVFRNTDYRLEHGVWLDFRK